MGYDEHEMLIEYSEMTAFNFNSKEFQELRKDVKKCKDAAGVFENILRGFLKHFEPEAV